MARKRLPTAIADTVGASLKNPQRYRGGPKSAATQALGAPPTWLSPHEAEAWRMFAHEMPWLSASDRTLTAIASKLRSRLMRDPAFGMKATNELRLCLTAMGGTPADRSKVAHHDDDTSDPATEFLN